MTIFTLGQVVVVTLLTDLVVVGEMLEIGTAGISIKTGVRTQGVSRSSDASTAMDGATVVGTATKDKTTIIKIMAKETMKVHREMIIQTKTNLADGVLLI